MKLLLRWGRRYWVCTLQWHANCAHNGTFMCWVFSQVNCENSMVTLWVCFIEHAFALQNSLTMQPIDWLVISLPVATSPLLSNLPLYFLSHNVLWPFPRKNLPIATNTSAASREISKHLAIAAATAVNKQFWPISVVFSELIAQPTVFLSLVPRDTNSIAISHTILHAITWS